MPQFRYLLDVGYVAADVLAALVFDAAFAEGQCRRRRRGRRAPASVPPQRARPHAVECLGRPVWKPLARYSRSFQGS